jgi:hypothetical protein
MARCRASRSFVAQLAFNNSRLARIRSVLFTSEFFACSILVIEVSSKRSTS